LRLFAGLSLSVKVFISRRKRRKEKQDFYLISMNAETKMKLLQLACFSTLMGGTVLIRMTILR
jgi:hypothetical protein